MAKLFDKVTVEIEYPSGTWTEIVPDVDDIQFSKKRDDGKYFYRLSLDTELLLRKAAWSFISEIEETDHCAEINIRITPTNGTAFEGALSLNDGDFDFSNCAAIIKASTSDAYTCLENGLKKEVNILGTAVNEVLNFAVGTFVTTSCPPSGTTPITGLVPTLPPAIDSCLTDPDTWSLLENHFTNISPNGTGAAPPFDADQRSVWIREEVTSATEPPGLGWVDIGGGVWARAPQMVFDETNTTDQPPPESEWHIYYTLAFGEIEPIDNGVLLPDLLEYMLNDIECPLPVVSDFFMINPDFTNPSNDVYTAAQAKLNNLLFFQKSDVKRAGASNNATSGIMTIEELFNYLANRMQVFPALVDGNLRLEHITYYQDKPITLDLTAASYDRWVRGAKRYTYFGNSPSFIKFTQFEATNRPSFEGVQIEFPAACASKDAREVQLPSGRFVADLLLVISNPELFSDDGFVVVNAIEFAGGLYVDTEINALNGDETVNGHLSVPNLQDNYWRDYAYQSTGKLNSDAIIFNSTRPNKRGIPITVPNWCWEDFMDFDASTLVLTPLGNGEVERITYSVKKGTATFELIYGGGTTS